MPAVFIAQSTLTQWSDAGKVRVEETTLILIAENRSVDLIPAVRFTEVEVGDEDPDKLVGKVKTKTQLDEMSAEHYMESVIVGDVAYKVVEGFMGDLAMQKPIAPQTGAKGAQPAASAAAAPATSKAQDEAAPEPSEDGEDEAAKLSKLFLDTVT